jgi:RNA-directed DNA polymerase
VILSRQHAAEAREGTGKVMSQIGLTLNAAKTSVQDARRETFHFLGYPFGPMRHWQDGHWYTAARPGKKAIGKLKQAVYDLLQPSAVNRWEEVRDQLNRKLRGWKAFFNYGTLYQAYQEVDAYVWDGARYFLRRRQQRSGSRAARRFSAQVVHGKLGVVRLYRE